MPTRRTHVVLLLTLLAATVGASCSSTPAKTGLQVVDLGIEGESSAATAISPNTRFVAGTTVAEIDGADVSSIFVHDRTRGTTQIIAPLAGRYARPEGVTDDGDVVGMSSVKPGTDAPVAPVASIDGKLVRLPGSETKPFGAALSINQAGVIVGWIGDADENATEPASWERGELTRLGSFGGTFGQALDVNDVGDVVGWSQLAGDPFRSSGFVTKGQLSSNGALPGLGGDTVFFRSLNSSGIAVGDASTVDGLTEAVSWTADSGTATITKPFGDGTYVLASGIDDRGQIVGSAPVDDAGEDLRAWTRLADGTVSLLDDLTKDSTWTVRYANDISEGVIAAEAERDGAIRAVVVLPK